MIDKLITALSKKAGMSTEEIADTIWLALQIQESQSESVSSDFSLVEEDIGAIENKTTTSDSKPQTPDSNEIRKNLDSEAQKAKIYPQSQQQTESLDLSFKTPNAPSLRQPLTLARALKPLMRRIPAGTNFVLDEAATIEGIANTKLWLPVLRPTLEPWLDLELVVDESISMQIWRQTIRDLEKLLKNYGIFRDVRVWGMTANDGEKVQVRRGIGAAAKNKFPRSSKELIDGSGRRLILVVSDCVSSYWRDGTVTKALEIWANSVPTAIIQMLPKWLWKRTALGRASEVRLRALTPGVSNQNLIAQEVSLWEELEEKKGVKVPIFTLEEDKATTWAQMLSGKSSVSTLGFVFKLDAPVKENKLFNLDYSQLSAEDRVQAFRVTASPMARKLAGLLAAAPVISLPVVRLIRGALLPESLQVNVAEVFLGGLLKPLSEIKVESNSDDVLYGFVDGVRELLIDSMPSEWVLQVVDKVSEYVAERVGLSLEDFAAVLRREKEVEDSGVVEEVGYFATVTAQVLRRLGGEYGKVAEELELNSREGYPAVKLTTVNIQAFFNATDPGIPLFIDNAEIDTKYYIDFSPVRGGEIIKKLKKTILWYSDIPTCQLFTGHIGCGKSTELWRLKQQLELEGFHVVYVESDRHIEMGDVDISDILLTIAQQVSKSLETWEKLNLEEPTKLKTILQGAAKLLQTEIEISNIELSFGIGKITAEAKASPEVRSKLREYLGPRTSGIIETINQELFEPANEKLKQYDKNGLVVIVDNLDKVDNTIKYQDKTQPEYLFVDRGEQLTRLQCHVIYTIPLALRFSNDYEALTQRFKKDPQILPMVATQLRDGSECAEGMELVRQLVLARAFPELDPQQRLAKVTEIFDSQETLDYLCRFSGGHVRNVLRIVNDAIMEESELPISHSSMKNVIRSYHNERILAIDDQEWELLRQVAVARTKKVTGDDGYQTLIRSMFVYEYQDDRGSWFDVNPLLKDALESQ